MASNAERKAQREAIAQRMSKEAQLRREIREQESHQRRMKQELIYGIKKALEKGDDPSYLASTVREAGFDYDELFNIAYVQYRQNQIMNLINNGVDECNSVADFNNLKTQILESTEDRYHTFIKEQFDNIISNASKQYPICLKAYVWENTTEKIVFPKYYCEPSLATLYKIGSCINKDKAQIDIDVEVERRRREEWETEERKRKEEWEKMSLSQKILHKIKKFLLSKL